jgi:hypothetical protein
VWTVAAALPDLATLTSVHSDAAGGAPRLEPRLSAGSGDDGSSGSHGWTDSFADAEDHVPPAAVLWACAGVFLGVAEQCEAALLCYRLNVFVKPSLRVLLHDLELEALPMARRLQPVTRFVRAELERARRVLVPPVFGSLVRQLWATLCANFAEPLAPEVIATPAPAGSLRPNPLVPVPPLSPALAAKLCQALGFLQQLFVAQEGALLPVDVAASDWLAYTLQLHTLPTLDLCTLFAQVRRYWRIDWAGGGVFCC